MKSKTIIFGTILLISISCQSWADSEKIFSKDDVKQSMTNNIFSFIDKDTVSALYALSALRQGESQPVLELFEYQLDIIVCETWEVKDQLSAPSKQRAMELLQKIKAYRQTNPRKIEAKLSRDQIKSLFSGASNSDIDYTDRAKIILAGLK